MFFIGTVEKYNLCRTYKSSIPTRFIGTFEAIQDISSPLYAVRQMMFRIKHFYFYNYENT